MPSRDSGRMAGQLNPKPWPVTIGKWSQPASLTAVQQDRPALGQVVDRQKPGGQRQLGPVEQSNAGDLLKTFRRLRDNVEHARPKSLHQLAGVDRADALDHAGAEVALDALQRGLVGRS